MTLYLDLDGPLLDVARRYHEVYRSIVRELGGEPLQRESYWGLKRSGRRETEICAASHPEIDPVRYLDLFVERIEAPSRLAEDTLADGASRTLAALRGRHRLVLATLRRRGAAMRGQLAALGILESFDGILQAEGNEGSWSTKAALIAADRGFDPAESLLVGDTEGDVLAARRVGISVLGVRNGLREPRVLTAAGPCVLIDTIEGLIGWLQEGGRTSRRESTMGERTCARW